MYQKNKVLMIALLMCTNIFCSMPGYGALKEVHLGKQKTDEEASAKFQKEYEAELMRLWNDKNGNLKREYKNRQEALAADPAKQKILYKQFVFDILKEAYKQKHTEHFSLRPVGEHAGNLDDKAHRAVQCFIEEKTTCGCCWLCCAHIR